MSLLYRADYIQHFLYKIRVTLCRRQSNIPHWLSISQPSCRRLWRWRRGLPWVTVHHVPIHRNSTAVLLLPTSPLCVQNPFHNNMFQTQVRGGVLLRFLFASFSLHSHIIVIITADVIYCKCVDPSVSLFGWRFILCRNSLFIKKIDFSKSPDLNVQECGGKNL